MASPAPIRPAPSDAQAWRDALEAMKPITPPCPGMTGARWLEMRETGIDFLDRFGGEASTLDRVSERSRLSESPWRE